MLVNAAVGLIFIIACTYAPEASPLKLSLNSDSPFLCPLYLFLLFNLPKPYMIPTYTGYKPIVSQFSLSAKCADFALLCCALVLAVSAP